MGSVVRHVRNGIRFKSGSCGAQTLADIPEQMEMDEGTNHRRGKDPDDTFVLVKRYISAVELRQPPLLVLTPEHRNTFALMTNRCMA